MAGKSRLRFETVVSGALESRENIDSKIHAFTQLLSGFLDGAIVSALLFEPEEGELFLKSTSLRMKEAGMIFRFSSDGIISSIAIDENRVVKMKGPLNSPLKTRENIFRLKDFVLIADDTFELFAGEKASYKLPGAVSALSSMPIPGLLSAFFRKAPIVNDSLK